VTADFDAIPDTNILVTGVEREISDLVTAANGSLPPPGYATWRRSVVAYGDNLGCRGFPAVRL